MHAARAVWTLTLFVAALLPLYGQVMLARGCFDRLSYTTPFVLEVLARIAWLYAPLLLPLLLAFHRTHGHSKRDLKLAAS